MSTEAGSTAQQLALGFTRPAHRDFRHFVAGPNAGLVAAVESAALRPSAIWPLIWGPAGCGKTHLLLAAVHAGSTAGRRSIYLAGDELLRHAPEALDATGGAELVCLDDVDHLFGVAAWEESLFHALNRLRRAGAGLILSAGTAPAAFRIDLADLRSRLSWGTTHAMFPLDEASRREVIRQRARVLDLPLSEEVVDYLYRRARRDTASLVALVDALAELALAEKRRVTVPLARRLLNTRRE